ncbi:uncharacterized protein LOC111884923 isoform X1 [Lactuca sativa]|uniref:uncharacterized protein LOC111884923 isoform X1 n=1 Tax=Lactuca sativa TaxID=4236 RepID=UPI000CD960E6|nr:uncharacterized protein LOC111884923 isoform X1 [Lactuca sativa]
MRISNQVVGGGWLIIPHEYNSVIPTQLVMRFQSIMRTEVVGIVRRFYIRWVNDNFIWRQQLEQWLIGWFKCDHLGKKDAELDILVELSLMLSLLQRFPLQF